MPMKFQYWLVFSILTLLAIISHVHAAPGFSPQSMKQLYKDGEFEKVRAQLESFLKRSDATASREDRILAYKYLGVVYASKQDGIPQAEAYFFRLFDLAPKVQLTELYVSSSVNDLFQKTRERFLSEKQTSSSIDEYGNPIENKNAGQVDPSDTVTKTKEPNRNSPRQTAVTEKKGPSIWPWMLGAVVVGGGIGLYVMSSEEPDAKKEQIIAGGN
jgi:tetratricopeptide (TPR) repeat protein